MNAHYHLDRDVNVLAVFYFGRSGSYFLQSLLDSHPNVLAIPPGCLISFFDFWRRNQSLPKAVIIQNFLSDYREMIDPDYHSPGVSFGSAIRCLGPDRNITLTIDQAVFSAVLEETLKPINTLTRRQLFLAVHYAYNAALGLPIPENFVLVFQAHNCSDNIVLDLLNDFPTVKFIHSVRYPIQALGSYVKHHAEDLRERFGFSGSQLLAMLRTVIEGGAEIFPGYNKIARAIRLEDLHARPRDILLRLCQWIDIPWNDSLLQSTIGGHLYSFPTSYAGNVSGFSTHAQRATHDDIFTSLDKFRFELIFQDKCGAWKYPVTTFPDDAIVEKLMLYPFRMEKLLTTEEIGNGFSFRLRELLSGAYTHATRSALTPVPLLDADVETENCGWDRVISEKELFVVNRVYGGNNAFAVYYQKAATAYENGSFEEAGVMARYALMVKPDSEAVHGLLAKLTH